MGAPAGPGQKVRSSREITVGVGGLDCFPLQSRSVAIDPSALDALPRDELIARARKLGIVRPEVMTRVELKDEIVRRLATDEVSRRRARGWLGVARDLVASLIEQGLNMPDAAKLVRSGVTPTGIRHQPPVATVTLAEIYAAQGHVSRALAMLDEVLEKEPDHGAASALRARLARESGKSESARPRPTPRAPLIPEPEAEAEPAPEPEPEPEPEAPPAEPEPVAVEPAPRRVPTSIVTIVAESGAVHVFWELDDATLARAGARWPGGRPMVRVVALVPRWEGARRFERELPAEPASGSSTLQPFGERAVIRVALGIHAADGFHPLAIGTELEPPAPGSGPAVRWAPSQRAVADPAVQARAASEYRARHAG